MCLNWILSPIWPDNPGKLDRASLEQACEACSQANVQFIIYESILVHCAPHTLLCDSIRVYVVSEH